VRIPIGQFFQPCQRSNPIWQDIGSEQLIEKPVRTLYMYS
jgi:hypothetical protein